MMDSVHSCLERLSGATLGTVVHVNPVDEAVVERYAGLGAARIVLVHGDPECIVSMRRATAGRHDVEVIEAVVAPNTGPARWLRFNVRELNGVLAPEGLRGFYPRLQLLETVPVTAVTLRSLLDRVQGSRAPGRADLLVLEAPGQEVALLESLSPDMLRHFEWLLLRGARDGLYEGGCAEGAAREWLEQRHFATVAESQDIEPLWPVTLLRYDGASAERAALSRRVVEQDEELSALALAKASLERLVREHEDRAELLEKACNEQTLLAREREAQVQALAREKAQLEQLARERQGKLDGVTQLHAEQLKKLGDTQAKVAAERLDELKKVQAEHAKELGERDARLNALEREAAGLRKLEEDRRNEIAQIAKAHEDAAKLAKERLAQIEQLTGVRDELAKRQRESEARAEALAKEKAQLATDRDAQVKLAAERQAQANDRQKRIQLLEAELADAQLRLELLHQEVLKAEGQLDVVKELLLHEEAL